MQEQCGPDCFTMRTVPLFEYGLSLAVSALLASGCATKPVPSKPVFHPPPPDPPRIQLLTSLSRPAQVEEPSRFWRFLLGPPPPKPGIVKPYGVAFSRGRLLVCDSGARAIHVIDLAQRSWNYALQGKRPGLMTPINIAADTDGTLYLCDSGLRKVFVYDADLQYAGSFATEETQRPVDIAIGKDRLYVADVKGHRLTVYDKATRRFLSAIPASPKSDAERLFSPVAVTVDKDGFVYVSDTGAFRVQKYDSKGVFQRSFGQQGMGTGQFVRNKGVAVDRDGRVYVVDAASERIQIFSPEGRLLLYFPAPELGGDNLVLPAQVSIDYDNIGLFSQYIAADFEVEYLVIVTNQYGQQMVKIYGFGHKK